MSEYQEASEKYKDLLEGIAEDGKENVVYFLEQIALIESKAALGTLSKDDAVSLSYLRVGASSLLSSASYQAESATKKFLLEIVRISLGIAASAIIQKNP